MKILILQLTRYGDILCTLPTIAAIKRQHPEAQVHFLVRQRFAEAAEGSRFIDHLWKLDSQKILGSLVTQGPRDEKISSAIETLQIIINQLRAEKFDRIINLSFSPSSSYLTHLIARGQTPVSGYTRTSDLFLHVPDKASQYFRSQVGLERSNRLHVTDLFAWAAGVALIPSDWSYSGSAETEVKSGIVCHMGASQDQKTWPTIPWVALLNQITGVLGQTVTLVGSPTERPSAENVALQVGSSCLINLVGETSFSELARIIQGAELFIGADSGPLHVADCVGTRSLNLSLGNVRFWETGPIVPRSRVLVSRQPAFLSSELVFQQVEEMLKGRRASEGVVECGTTCGVRYQINGKNPTPDFWPVVEWIYFDGPSPQWSPDLRLALGQVQEICGLALQQLEVFLAAPTKIETIAILDRIDELLKLMQKTLPPLEPLLSAFFCEKENIPPGPREEVFYQTRLCYERLQRRTLLPRDFHKPKGQDHERENLDP